MGSLFKREKIDITGKTNNIYLSTFLFDNLIQTPSQKSTILNSLEYYGESLEDIFKYNDKNNEVIIDFKYKSVEKNLSALQPKLKNLKQRLTGLKKIRLLNIMNYHFAIFMNGKSLYDIEIENDVEGSVRGSAAIQKNGIPIWHVKNLKNVQLKGCKVHIENQKSGLHSGVKTHLPAGYEPFSLVGEREEYDNIINIIDNISNNIDKNSFVSHGLMLNFSNRLDFDKCFNKESDYHNKISNFKDKILGKVIFTQWNGADHISMVFGFFNNYKDVLKLTNGYTLDFSIKKGLPKNHYLGFYEDIFVGRN